MSKMMFPRRVLEALSGCHVQETFGSDARLGVRGPIASSECEVARHHSPYPLLTHLIPLIPDEWGEVVELSPMRTTILACGTCRDSIRVMQHLLWVSNGTLDWTIRREFGNRVREMVEASWVEFKSLPVREMSDDE